MDAFYGHLRVYSAHSFRRNQSPALQTAGGRGDRAKRSRPFDSNTRSYVSCGLDAYGAFLSSEGLV